MDFGERRESSDAAWFERSWTSVMTRLGLGEEAAAAEDGVDDVVRPLEEEAEAEEEEPAATLSAAA